MSSNTGTPFTKGLHEVGDGVFAYLQPDGGWGWSNAGLVAGDGESLLVDTLFDLNLTAEMLSAMEPLVESRPISTLVNTHANGDHCYGNQMVDTAHVIASRASAAEMEELPPAALAALMKLDLDPVTSAYLDASFGAFEFDGIEPPRVDETFDGHLRMTIGDRRVELIEVGPAHTAGDTLVHLVDDNVIFTGDILFIDGTPIVWNGPVANWIAACDRIIESAASVIVPGHGPLTDADGVRRVADYLRFLRHECGLRHAEGMTASDAARDIELGAYADWLDWERLVINVDSIYRELDPDHPAPNVIELFADMAALHASRRH